MTRPRLVRINDAARCEDATSRAMRSESARLRRVRLAKLYGPCTCERFTYCADSPVPGGYCSFCAHLDYYDPCPADLQGPAS